MIFHDLTSKRWKWFRFTGIVLTVIVLLLMGDWLATILTGPTLPPNIPIQHTLAEVLSAGWEAPALAAAIAPASTKRSTDSLKRLAFVVQDDPASVTDLKNHLADIDIVCPDWLTCPTAKGNIVATLSPAVEKLLGDAKVQVYPRLSNTDAKGNWLGDSFSEVLNDYDSLNHLSTDLMAALQEHHCAGVNIDFENLRVADSQKFLDLLDTLAAQLHKAGMKLSIDVPLNDPAFDYEAIGKTADFVIMMAYDEHYAGNTPGAIASNDWFTDGLDRLTGAVPPEKLIVALGAYGYDWNISQKKNSADSLGFFELMALADDTGSEIETDADAHNSHFSYEDADHNKHAVWFLDAISAWNEMVMLRDKKVAGVGLWRLGMEEPSLWKFFGSHSPVGFDPKELSTIEIGGGVSVVGEGEFLKVKHLATPGKRSLTFDGRLIDYASYERLPTCCMVEKTGHADRQIALTFDDGPDPKWTPEILDVLKKNNCTAAFFVVGDQAQRFPELVKEEVAEGHIVGNHTFFHPNLMQCTEERTRIELNLTQRAIESITGRHTLLFRAPFDTDSSPTTSAQLTPLHAATDMGYIITAADIDSQDYLRPGPPRIVNNVLTQLEQTDANIIVFHDAGGDRSQTVAAVATLIPALRDKGYEIVGLDELLDTTRESIMPPISMSERCLIIGSDACMWARSTGWTLMAVLFFFTTMLSIARIVFLSLFVVRKRKFADPAFTPPVLVLIPSYNEEKVIARTLRGVLASDYPNLSVLVIDDGSTDGTASAVRCVAEMDVGVRLLSIPNGGKSAALNRGFLEAEEDYIVTIDADTIITPSTVRELIAPMSDPAVDAVCGNVQVGNIHNLLTRFQDVEYVTSQNYDRRAFDSLNCISVVPGATGGWRRKAVTQAGGYSDQTLTEDADLTLTLLRRGARIVYAPEARSITEAPETISALTKQRFRWSFGTLQCLWKHRRAFFHGALGWIALPNMFLFQLLFPLLSPLGDAVFLLALFRGDSGAILAGYLMFLAMDVIGGVIAFQLDRRDMHNLWIVLIQRFFYRQFMYIVTIRTVLAAIRGRRHGWNKLERQGTIKTDETVPSLSVWIAPAMTPCD